MAKQTDARSSKDLSAAKSLLIVLSKGGKIFSHIRKKWLDETPEEKVRQEYLCILVNE